MNQLQSQKTPKASFDILGDRLKVIDFLMKSGRFHTFTELRRQTGLPDRRLRDILNNRCEGYVARQCDRYGYSRKEKALEQTKSKPQSRIKPKPIKSVVPEHKPDLAKLAKKEKAKMRSQLPALRKAAFEIFKQLPNVSESRAMLMAYQQHPDI